MAKYSQEDRESLASAITAVDTDADSTFYSRLASILSQQQVDLPAVWIEYSHLQVVRPAVNSASSLPSLPNILKRCFKVRLL